MRLFLLFLLVSVVLLLPFLLWGGAHEARFSMAGTQEWLAVNGKEWGWLAAAGLLTADVVLPVPATGVMSALGYVYGAVAGGFIGAAGSFLSGALGYGLCRRWGERAAARLLSPEEREKGARLFAGPAGGWLVALSRWMPLLPEVTACMAGLTGMPAGRFFPALACGCVPMAFVFAAIGAEGVERPAVAIGLSVVIPAALYGLAALVMARSAR